MGIYAPFVTKFLTTIIILFSNWLYNYLIYHEERVAPDGQSLYRGASMQKQLYNTNSYIYIVQNKTSSYLSTPVQPWHKFYVMARVVSTELLHCKYLGW